MLLVQLLLGLGTIFASTKLELKVWFRAMYLMTQTKQGISRLDTVLSGTFIDGYWDAQPTQPQSRFKGLDKWPANEGRRPDDFCDGRVDARLDGEVLRVQVGKWNFHGFQSRGGCRRAGLPE